MPDLERRVWLLSVRDEETGLMLQGTLEADSEIEARGKIILTVERMFLRTQMIAFDRVPEEITSSVRSMHEMVHRHDPSEHAAYHIGGPDAEGQGF